MILRSRVLALILASTLRHHETSFAPVDGTFVERARRRFYLEAAGVVAMVLRAAFWELAGASAAVGVFVGSNWPAKFWGGEGLGVVAVPPAPAENPGGGSEDHHQSGGTRAG